MKQILNIIVLIIFWTFLFVLLHFISEKLCIGFMTCIPALYLVLLFVSISYKYFWSFQTFNNKKGIIKFISVVFASFIVLLYLTNLVYLAHVTYKSLVSDHKGSIEGIEYQPDDTLGFKPIPNARAFQTYYIGGKIPIAYDKDGFRIPLSDTSKVKESNKIGLLFLGDSFTFGAGCHAEETFPSLVAKESKLSYINAGVSSYGLAHMQILAERLIPKYKPDYVIVQYSPWLVSRGTNIFAPIDTFHIPVPYFAERNNSYVLNPPIYNDNILKSIDTKTIKSSYKGKFIKFLFKVAFPFSLQEIWHHLKTKILLITRRHLRPATNLVEVEKYAYNRIKTVAEKNGTTVIILNLGNIEYSKNSHSLFSNSNICFAEADSSLNDFLKTSISKDYFIEFGQWKLNDKNNIILDYHPNSKAHRLIANTIIKKINKK